MKKGFESNTFDSQAVFRQVLLAMANPGTIMDIGMNMDLPDSIHGASGAILLSLMDFETPFCSDLENSSDGVQWLKFHTGAPYTYVQKQADFALYTVYDLLTDPGVFNPGTIESPDQSTTVIVQTRGLNTKGRIRMTGPGIKKEAFLYIKGVREIFFKNREILAYPLGIDLIFVCDQSFVAVPRTTKLEIL